jgi:hypothetical protein
LAIADWTIADWRLDDFRLPIADCRLAIADCGLPISPEHLIGNWQSAIGNRKLIRCSISLSGC